MTEQRLARRRVIAYAAPYVGLAWFQGFFTNYFYKYSVDVLLIAPATIAAILSLTRLWDAFSDPVAGYLSDRTSVQAGRRRPWLLGSAIPVGLITFFMWNPPRGLDPVAMIIWMAVAVTLWETAMTGFSVPYYALGSEVSMDHHDRTRVAGYRHVLGGAGGLVVIGCVYWITHSEVRRDAALWVFTIGCVIAPAIMMGGIWYVREQPGHRELGSRAFFRSLRNALRNPHLMRLVTIYFFDISGVAAMGLLGAFIAEYVVGQRTLIPFLMLTYSLASYVSTPLTVLLSRRFGKKQVWMLVLALSATGFLLSLLTGHGDRAYLLFCVALAGLGSTGGQVVGMSLLADAADFDELRTGERREGVYYAAINIARKVMFSAATFLVGFAMDFLIGFEPNVQQTPEALRGIKALFAGIPATGFFIAIVLLLTFRLTEDEHRSIRAQLDSRS